jgi:hypothetical protein
MYDYFEMNAMHHLIGHKPHFIQTTDVTNTLTTNYQECRLATYQPKLPFMSSIQRTEVTNDPAADYQEQRLAIYQLTRQK